MSLFANEKTFIHKIGLWSQLRWKAKIPKHSLNILLMHEARSLGGVGVFPNRIILHPGTNLLLLKAEKYPSNLLVMVAVGKGRDIGFHYEYLFCENFQFLTLKKNKVIINTG